MPRIRTIGRATTVVVSACFAIALASSSAQAVTSYDSSFGSSGTGAGQFASPTGLAVNQTTGDIYVADSALNRVSRFDSGGTFILTWGSNVNESTGGDICTALSGDTCKAGDAAVGSGGFSSPIGLGVDASTGDVYVQDRNNNRVQRFTSNGDFVLMWGKGVNATTGGRICTAASEDTCKAGSISGDGTTTPPTPSTKGEFSGWPVGLQGITVGPDGLIYVTEPKSIPWPRIQVFNSMGEFVGQNASPQLVGVFSGMVNPRSPSVNEAGDVYLTNNDAFERAILKFNADTLTPDAETQPSQKFGRGSRLHNVAVDPSNQFLIAIGIDCLTSPGIGPAPELGEHGLVHIVEYHPSSQEVDCSIPPGELNTKDVGATAMSTTHKLYLSVTSPPEIRVFDTPVATPPELGPQTATEITSSKVVVKSKIAANLSETTVHAEYGTAPCSANPCASTEERSSIGAAYTPAAVGEEITGLEPDTTYYYRLVATNGAGVSAGPDRSFHTYPTPVFDPSCGNNLARQQTRASFLLDCRAYELVSAENQGGYDVESNLIPGQTPFGGYPLVDGKALYAIHNGGIPGKGKPTNRGIDPYVATRDAANRRWDTEYVGIPADAPSTEPFSSTVAGADSELGTFAFGGPEICHPCFGDGSAGLPVRTVDGSLAQGMVGSIEVADPVAAGEVRKPLPDNGKHFIFGSEQQFEPEGNPDNGNVTIYDRDLQAGTTQVVSTDVGGTALANGSGVAELDVSADSSRILIGELVNEEAGNKYWHLYMHIGDDPESVDLTPGVSDGVLYGGMSADGSTVYFTTVDQLTTATDQDTDESADIYRAQVDSAGSALSRVSTGEGGAGDVDGCNPAANSYNPSDWNMVPGGPTNCSAVAVGGGGGVATGDGTIYFLSPELLDGDGVAGAPNLFIARPGAAPRFVATLESSANSPLKTGAPDFKSYVGAFTNPAGAAIDRASGAVYVYDIGNAESPSPGAYVQRFDTSGNPDLGFAGDSVLSAADDAANANFTAIGGGFFGLVPPTPTQVAVDNSGGTNAGDLYVTDAAGSVKRFSASGVHELTIPVGGGLGVFDLVTGVSVNPTNGNVYASFFSVFTESSSVYVFDESGSPTAPTSFGVPGFVSSLAVDSTSNVYVATGSAVKKYNPAGTLVSTVDSNASSGVAVDPGVLANPEDDTVYVDRGNGVFGYYSDGAPIGPIGSGLVSGSIGLGADSGSLAVGNPGNGNVAVFRPVIPLDRAYDSPLVIDSVRAAESRKTDEFQASASGDHAALPTTLPPGGFDSAGKYEVLRYDAVGDLLSCASCSTTEETPTSDAGLAPNGLSITNDGRVFFTTGEPLVLRDANSKSDAYEWKEGKTELISSGQSRFDSRLLSVTADGKDAYFFTRETLTPNDENGSLAKLYDAREDGGFFTVPPPPPCAASDECHGPGSEAAPPADISTLEGRGGNAEPGKRCNAKKLGRRAGRLSRRSKALRRRAKSASGKRPLRLRRAARQKGRAAKRASNAAKKCRRQRRRGK